MSQRSLNRRAVLRGTGVSMALPWLSAMNASVSAGDPVADADRPRRFVAMTFGLGLLPENLFPDDAGLEYQPSRYLRPLQPVRDKLTVVSGVSHPGVTGGHRAEASILTATAMGSSGRSSNSISIDQYLAKHLGDATRFPSLVLATDGSNSPCYTESGAMIPPMTSPRDVFDRLFVDGSVQQRRAQAERVKQGRSIMDLVAEDVRSLQGTLGAGDRNRLDAYFTSVRQLEQRMKKSQQWAMRPKPSVATSELHDVADPNNMVGRIKTMCDIIKLALETDSTRYITLHVPGNNRVFDLEGVEEGYHSLSHHGRDEDKLDQLAIVEEAMLSQWGEFLGDLHQTADGDSTLLDQTTLFLTSNLGNASNHDNRNMPVLIAGGGFDHAGHLAFDRKNNYPLPNFYVSLLQQSGMAVDQFASSTGTMRGLEPNVG
ncbi:MAG: DUF1552 domain-containing protein [Planctomycetota bacterium]